MENFRRLENSCGGPGYQTLMHMHQSLVAIIEQAFRRSIGSEWRAAARRTILPAENQSQMPDTNTDSLDRPMAAAEWEARYLAKDWPWEKGEPSPGLVDFLANHPRLETGTVLVPGCGTGHDVRAWAKAGLRATGFDIAASAVQLGREWTAAAGLSADFHLADFVRDEPRQQFDWLFEHTLFCAIHPSERDVYVRAVLRWLKPDGHDLAVSYLLTDPGGPPYSTTREEQVERFSPHFDLLEEWVPRSYPNRVGLERMFWWKRKR